MMNSSNITIEEVEVVDEENDLNQFKNNKKIKCFNTSTRIGPDVFGEIMKLEKKHRKKNNGNNMLYWFFIFTLWCDFLVIGIVIIVIILLEEVVEVSKSMDHFYHFLIILAYVSALVICCLYLIVSSVYFCVFSNDYLGIKEMKFYFQKNDVVEFIERMDNIPVEFCFESYYPKMNLTKYYDSENYTCIYNFTGENSARLMKVIDETEDEIFEIIAIKCYNFTERAQTYIKDKKEELRIRHAPEYFPRSVEFLRDRFFGYEENIRFCKKKKNNIIEKILLYPYSPLTWIISACGLIIPLRHYTMSNLRRIYFIMEKTYDREDKEKTENNEIQRENHNQNVIEIQDTSKIERVIVISE